MKISLSVLRNILGTIFGIKHFVLIASLVFFAIIGLALYLIFENAKIMQERINTDFNQMQLVLAHQAATQIDSDLREISKELEILGRNIKDIPDEFVESSINTFNERTYPKGVVAAGLIDSENRLLHYSEFEDAPSPIKKEGFHYRELASVPALTLGKLLPVENDRGGSEIYGFICLPYGDDGNGQRLRHGEKLHRKNSIRQNRLCLGCR